MHLVRGKFQLRMHLVRGKFQLRRAAGRIQPFGDALCASHIAPPFPARATACSADRLVRRDRQRLV